MGCTSSTHTIAQDTTRVNTKLEECNGAYTTEAASESSGALQNFEDAAAETQDAEAASTSDSSTPGAAPQLLAVSQDEAVATDERQTESVPPEEVSDPSEGS
ncbi:uncharacterized protein si:dkey-284p5.3 isoform X2 [Electrophorus electricus]|uniref:uncharacterized protein si:dkey-284p5.3 isoform X2 n=1 Tax=Electrophorus electricus TaxID=8005 RepID=UPI0015D03D1F|nr:uncharacterized protein si:dkey-284p5.3 isoform X2 [Electrophorus electricus]